MSELPRKIHLTVVTRERRMLDVEADDVVLPGSNGYFGVLPGHTPMLASLRIGLMAYRNGGREQRMVLSWGFAEVLPDRVTVLAEGAFGTNEIDLVAAERELLEAQRELTSLASHDEEFARAEGKLEEAIAKIQAVGRIV